MVGTSITVVLNLSIGKMDKILHATAFLCHRLHAITMHRKKNGFDNIYPSLSEVKTSHFICFDVSFKPCVLVAHEYYRQSAKNSFLGDVIDFELKFNCDYLNDTYIEYQMPQISCNTAPLGDIIVQPFDQDLLTINGNVPTNFGQARRALSGETANFLGGFSYVMSDATPSVASTATVVYNNRTYQVRVATDTLSGVGDISYLYTDATGNFIAGPNGSAVAPDANGFSTPASAQAPKVLRANYVRAAELVGIKISSLNTFIVDSNEVTSYNALHSVNVRERMMMKGMSRDNYDRLIGQEVPYDFVHEKQIYHNSNAPGLGLDLPVLSVNREYTKIASGLQTPKPFIDPHHLICPVQFWFNCKRKDAIPVLCMPDADIIHRVRTEPLNRLYYPAIGDTYIQEIVHLQNPAAVNGTLLEPNVDLQRRVPFIIPGSVVQSSGQFTAHIVMCHIYLDDCVHTILLHRIGFHLIRVIRSAEAVINNSNALKLEINGIKWPVEYIFVRDIPFENRVESSTDPLFDYPVAENWYRCGFQEFIPDLSTYVVNSIPQLSDDGVTPRYSKQVIQSFPGKIRRCTDAVTKFGVTIYDAEFYALQDRKFFSHYLTFAYCNGYIHSNDEPCSNIFFNFSQIPGMSQPSGHFNLSKTRNMEFDTETNLGPSGKVTLYVDAICINFIIISDGSLILRYV